MEAATGFEPVTNLAKSTTYARKSGQQRDTTNARTTLDGICSGDLNRADRADLTRRDLDQIPTASEVEHYGFEPDGDP